MLDYLKEFTPYDMFCVNLLLTVITFAMIIAFIVFIVIIRIGG